MCQSEPEQNENGRFCRVCFFRVAVQRWREKLNLISLTDSLISRLVNGDKTDFLKKLVELKIIQVEGMCIILVCVRAHITSGVFECVRAPGCMFVCVSVCDIKKVLQVYLPTQYTITHTLIFSSLHTYSYAYLYI